MAGDRFERYRRRLFGAKSQTRLTFDDARQASLFAAPGIEAGPAEAIPTRTFAHRRRVRHRDGAVNGQGPRFHESVAVETIAVADPAIEAIPQSQREAIGERVTHRPARESAVPGRPRIGDIAGGPAGTGDAALHLLQSTARERRAVVRR